MEDFENIWKIMNLMLEERKEISITKDSIAEELEKGEYCLVGKIHVDRTINRDFI